ncbi:hypothetical protein HRbin16_01893 [bacterium HR16]|nr:hypothetical protein HRbin16_01893 [bacterium HR16]
MDEGATPLEGEIPAEPMLLAFTAEAVPLHTKPAFAGYRSAQAESRN